MELVSGDVVLHEDILAVMLASMSFEDLLHKRQIPIFREATDSSITLDILARMYNLPRRDTFLGLLEEYDKINITPRCLRYHEAMDCGTYLASIGDLNGVKEASEKGWNDYESGIEEAVKGGHLDIVKYLHEKILSNQEEDGFFNPLVLLNQLLGLAAKGNYRDIIDYLIENDANNWNLGALGASEHNNIELVNFFTEKGADWNYVLEGGARGCNLDMVNYAIENGATNWNSGLTEAVYGKCKELIDFFVEKGANDFKPPLRASVYENDQDMIDYLIEKGSRDWDVGLHSAAFFGNKELIDFFIKKGATDIRGAISKVRDKNTKDYLRSFM